MLHSVMETTEQTPTKVQVAAKIDADLFGVIERFRFEEDRNLSNMIERLLKTHPRIQPILEGQTVEATA